MKRKKQPASQYRADEIFDFPDFYKWHSGFWVFGVINELYSGVFVSRIDRVNPEWLILAPGSTHLASGLNPPGNAVRQ